MKKDSGPSEFTGNIGPKEIRKRRILGIVALTAGALLAFALFALNAPRPFRLFVFFPIWLAGLGLFQAREKTCIALAARGVCNMDSGESEIVDKRTRKELREKARQINRRALMAAVIVTLVALAFPAGRI